MGKPSPFVHRHCTRDQGGEGCYGLKFADGAFADGQLLEIKSPMDQFSPGQAQSYNSASKKASGKPLAVASCESCENAKCPSAYQCGKTRNA